MKKILTTLCSLALIFVSVFGFVGCSNSNTNFTYVALVNNSTGFVTDLDETSISIGVAKGSSLLEAINNAISQISEEDRLSLMRAMVDLKKSDENTYTPGENAVIIDTDDTFKVAMECGYEPFNWTQPNDAIGAVPISNVAGKYANGYDVQIARIVANALGKKLVIIQSEWDPLIPGIKAGTFDAIIAGMSPTAERKEEIDFSNYYFTSNLVVVTKEGSRLATATTLSEIDNAEFRIAAQPGTSHLTLLQSQTSNCQIIDNLEDFPAMKIALEAGTIDGYIAEEPTAMALTK